MIGPCSRLHFMVMLAPRRSARWARICRTGWSGSAASTRSTWPACARKSSKCCSSPSDCWRSVCRPYRCAMPSPAPILNNRLAKSKARKSVQSSVWKDSSRRLTTFARYRWLALATAQAAALYCWARSQLCAVSSKPKNRALSTVRTANASDLR